MEKLAFKKVILTLLGLILLILGWSFISSDLQHVSTGWEYRMALFSVFLAAYYITAWKIMGLKFISPGFFILLSFWMFHISLVIVMGFQLKGYDPFIMLYRYGDQNSVKALLFSNVIITFYVLGMILFYKKENKRVEASIESTDLTEVKICRTIGLLLFAISILPVLYTNYVQVAAKIAEGYSGTMSADTSFHGIPLGWFTKLFLPSLLLIMASFKNDQKKCLRIVILTILYYMIFMFFTGRKGNTIQTIAPILVMYFFYFKPKIKIVHLAFLYCGIYLVTIVTKTRKMIVDADFWNQVKSIVMDTNPLTDLMFEMGGTIKAVIQMQMAVPETGTFQFGLTYLLGIIVSLAHGVNLNYVTPLEKHVNFDAYLSLPERGALLNSSVASMGGSSIAEWWWNFGWFSVLFIMIFAKLIISYETKLIKSLNNPTKFAMWCSFLYFLMRYTRGYITDLIWEPLFIFLCISVMYTYLKRKSQMIELKKNPTGESII